MILILTDPQIGGTFLSWSLHFLAGHEKYYSVRADRWTELTSDPIDQINAHKFHSNHPNYSHEILEFAEVLDKAESDQFQTLYFHNAVIEHLEDPMLSAHQPTVSAIQQLLEKDPNIKVVVLSNHHPLYHMSFNERVLRRKFTDLDSFATSFQEQHEDLIKYFFGNRLEEWKSAELSEIWDYREFLALNMRPFQSVRIIGNIDQKRDHYNIDSFDLYCVFDQNVRDLFRYLDIDIAENRFTQWTKVYHKWRKLHYDRMTFAWYFGQIVDYIIHGHYMDLERFNLDIVQEACIQHALIYQHNLNLKTWQLEKFKNTQQLNSLLEPNLHQLSI